MGHNTISDVPDEPPARPLESPATATLISPLLGVLSSTGIGSMLIGRGSPGGSRYLYKLTCSAVYFTIVWGHGQVGVSNAALYHPFRWQKDS